jgi:hypothetical protein
VLRGTPSPTAPGAAPGERSFRVQLQVLLVTLAVMALPFVIERDLEGHTA